MQSSHVLLVVLALLAGAGGVATGALLFGGEPGVRAAAVDARPAPDARVEKLAEQAGALAERVHDLELEVLALSAELDARPDVTAPAPVPVEVAGADPEVAAVVAALTDQQAALPDTLSAKIGDVVTAIREEERRQRDEERDEARALALERRLEELTEQLGLNGYQVDRMRDIYTDMQARRGEIFDTARASGDWMSVRDSFDALRSSSRESLAQVLTPDQLEKYDAMQNEWGWGGGFGRGWDGAGPPGGQPGGG